MAVGWMVGVRSVEAPAKSSPTAAVTDDDQTDNGGHFGFSFCEEVDQEDAGNKAISPKGKTKGRTRAVAPKAPAAPNAQARVVVQSPGKAGRGRPRRDLPETLTSDIERFRACDRGAIFFGSESKVVRRYLDRLLIDVDKALMIPPADGGNLSALVVLRKQLYSIINVLKVADVFVLIKC